MWRTFLREKRALEIFVDVTDIWKSKVKFSKSQTPSISRQDLDKIHW